MSKPDCIRDDYADRLMLGKDHQKDVCDLDHTLLLIITTNSYRSKGLKVRSPTTLLIPTPSRLHVSAKEHTLEREESP